MKKVFAMLVALSLVVASVTMSVFAADVGSNETTIDNVSLGQIQDIFVDYLDEKGLPLEPGTAEYYNYVLEQLLDHSDTDLCDHDNYDLIHAYMVEYKLAYEDYLLCSSDTAPLSADAIAGVNDCIVEDDSSQAIDFVLSESFLSKTIGDIIAENQLSSAKSPISRAATLSSYSGEDAAAYAKKYADGNNSTYPHYATGDCTNFVSQCIYAGGIKMDGSNNKSGTYDSTTDWYCIYINSFLGFRQYAVTTSWIRVADFNTYMSSLATKSTKTTISSLISACEVGDPVLLADKTTGTPYHAIIISGKDSSTAYYSGHTTSRNNVDVKDHLDQNSDKFYLFDLT